MINTILIPIVGGSSATWARFYLLFRDLFTINSHPKRISVILWHSKESQDNYKNISNLGVIVNA